MSITDSSEENWNFLTVTDTPQMAGKLIPPVFNKQTAGSSNPTQTTSKEMECPLSNEDKSPPMKKKTTSEMSTLDLDNSFEAKTVGATREISMLLTKYAEVLSERAAADTSQMKELDGLLTQARNLESYLKEKKNHLRNTLAVISDKLQG